MSDSISLDEVKTQKAIIDLSNCYDVVEKSFTDMNEVMSKLPTLFEGEVPDFIINKFGEFQDVFPLICENMKSYIQDFKNLIISFSNEDKKLSLEEVVIQEKGGELINVKNES